MDTGFRGAPVSKAFIGSCAICSVLWVSGIWKPHRRPLKPVQLLTFSHTGAFLFGLVLLFQSRNLERRSGSSKHAVLVGMSMGLHTLQLLVAPVQLPYGPLPFIFASLTLSTLETPAMQHFAIFGVRLTEKVEPSLHHACAACPIPHMHASRCRGCHVTYRCSGVGCRSSAGRLAQRGGPNVWSGVCASGGRAAAHELPAWGPAGRGWWRAAGAGVSLQRHWHAHMEGAPTPTLLLPSGVTPPMTVSGGHASTMLPQVPTRSCCFLVLC